MSEEAREAARRIVAEVLALQQGTDHTVPPDVHQLPATPPVAADPREDDDPTARRARALVAAVFDPPAAAPPAPPDPEQSAPTAAQLRARALVEEAAAVQEARARRTVEAPAGPRTDPPDPVIGAPPAPAEVDLFVAVEPEQPVEDRLFAQVADDEELPPAHRDLPPSLGEDVEGPPPPPVVSDEPPAVVAQRPTVPAAPASEPPRADLAARLVSGVLEDREGSATAAPARSAGPEDQLTQQLDQQLEEEEPRGVARWLVVTAVGAVTLALLLPLAVAAVRELLALS